MRNFESQGFPSVVLDDDALTPEMLCEKVTELFFERQHYIDAMAKSNQLNAIKTIMTTVLRRCFVACAGAPDRLEP